MDFILYLRKKFQDLWKTKLPQILILTDLSVSQQVLITPEVSSTLVQQQVLQQKSKTYFQGLTG